MNKKLIETYKQLEVYSEDMYMAEYGPLLLDLSFYANGTFSIRVIENNDWDSPIDELRFKTIDAEDLWGDVTQADLKNVHKKLDIFKKKIKNGEYDVHYAYKYENIAYFFFHQRGSAIGGGGIEGFSHNNIPGYKWSDEISEMQYAVVSALILFLKENYLDRDFNLIGDSLKFEHIMDVMNEFITYGDNDTKTLIVVGFVEGLQIPEEYLDNMKRLIKYPRLNKAIQDVYGFGTKGRLII